MERWRKIEESRRGFEGVFNSFSNCVLALPDSSALGDLLTIDKMIKGEMEIPDKLPDVFDSLEIGKIVTELEKRDVFIPNNFSLLGKRFYPFCLQECGIPIPRFEILDPEDGKLTREQIQRLSANNDSGLPLLFIVKPTLSHRGKGIRIVTGEELAEVQAEEDGVMIQRFWWPWKKSGYVRDARVVTINGEPRDFCVRQAKEPLIDPKTGELVEYPPSLPRVLANIVRGGKTAEVPRRLQSKLFDLARDTCSVIKHYAAWAREYSETDNPQMVNLGLISVDILLGEEGLAVCEVDTFPDLRFFPNLNRLGKPYVDYLKDQTEGGEKPVLLFKEILGTKTGMPISPETLERFLEQENIPHITAGFELRKKNS